MFYLQKNLLIIVMFLGCIKRFVKNMASCAVSATSASAKLDVETCWDECMCQWSSEKINWVGIVWKFEIGCGCVAFFKSISKVFCGIGNGEDYEYHETRPSQCTEGKLAFISSRI